MFFQLFYIVIVILWIRNDFYLLSKHRRNLHNVSKTFYARYVSLFFIFFLLFYFTFFFSFSPPFLSPVPLHGLEHSFEIEHLLLPHGSQTHETTTALAWILPSRACIFSFCRWRWSPCRWQHDRGPALLFRKVCGGVDAARCNVVVVRKY